MNCIKRHRYSIGNSRFKYYKSSTRYWDVIHESDDLPEWGGARSDLLELKKGRKDGLGVLLTDMVSNSGPLSDKSSSSSNNSSISMSPPLTNPAYWVNDSIKLTKASVKDSNTAFLARYEQRFTWKLLTDLFLILIQILGYPEPSFQKGYKLLLQISLL